MATTPNPPFNGIQISYPCQCCGDTHVGAPVRSPSGIVMGNVMLEKHVCTDCQLQHAQNLKDKFWGESSEKPKPGECHGCNCDLTGEKSHPVHASLNKDGTWRMGRVCATCFAEHVDICRENMKA